jgi:hypothetical protein
MKYRIAAAAALSVLGASAAMAQPYGYGGQQGYYDQQPYYGPQQPYRGQAYDDRGYGAPYGYAQPYTSRGYAYGGPAYNGGHYGARAHNYSYRNDRHVRRDRHHVAPRGRYDRHH